VDAERWVEREGEEKERGEKNGEYKYISGAQRRERKRDIMKTK
jgi:hypothetical protein